MSLLNITANQRILDVGGTADTWTGTGLEKNVTLLNLQSPNHETLKRGFQYIQGDACDMHMIADQSYDVVFSNSVIEHVGDLEKQRRFAGEIRRTGGKYWVQTPYRYFPLEPHLMFPLFQFMPVRARRFIALKWKYSHYKKWNLSDERILEELSRLRLLTISEMNQLFRDGQLYREVFFGLPKSLVSFRK